MTPTRAAIAGGILAGLAAGACYALGWLIASIPDDPARAVWSRSRKEAHRAR